MQTKDKQDQASRVHPAKAVVSSGNHHGLMQQFSDFYQNVNMDNLNRLADIYSDDVIFIDPVARHDGLQQLGGYFENLLEGCKAFQFVIHEAEIHNSKGWITWTLLFVHPRLNSGQQVELEGISLVEIANGKIFYQRDYYDMGVMVYENVPLLGRIIRYIRGRMQK